MPTIRLTSETKEEFDAYAAKLREAGWAMTHSDAVAYLIALATSDEKICNVANPESTRERIDGLVEQVESYKRERDVLAERIGRLQTANEALAERLRRILMGSPVIGDEDSPTDHGAPTKYTCQDTKTGENGTTLAQVAYEARAAARVLSRRSRPW